MGIFNKIFEKADKTRLFFDEVVWLPQEQECKKTGYPNCPDCKGTGDLRDSINTFKDTRLKMPSSPNRASIAHIGSNRRAL